jgi:hypothetical protein
MHWLLNEGGSSLNEQTLHGAHDLLLAANNERWLAVQWLLEEKGAKMTEDDNGGTAAWANLFYSVHRGMNVAELSSLLKVRVMLEDVPPFFIADLSPQHADICTCGRHFRAQLPSYLEHQRAAVVTHCPLPGVLGSLVTVYAVTTPEDMWADGLLVQALRAKRGRTKADKEDEEDAPPVRRSLRMRQKHV